MICRTSTGGDQGMACALSEIVNTALMGLREWRGARINGLMTARRSVSGSLTSCGISASDAGRCIGRSLRARWLALPARWQQPSLAFSSG